MPIRHRYVFVRQSRKQGQEAAPGSVFVSMADAYTKETGCGFIAPGNPSKDEDKRDSLPGDCSIPPVPTFAVDVPDGNYVVTVTLGDDDEPSSTTVKAGLGRLMLDRVATAAGQYAEATFAVHVDDGRLLLAFSGAAPRPATVEILEAANVPTLFLAGDSTVTDQPSGQYPYAGWGQMVPKLLNAGIAVSNYARSGRSSKSFITERRLERIWSRIRPGDYLFVQFAHNDEKDNEGGTDAHSTYPQYLQQYIDGARERGAHPVLVTAMHRRFFDEGGHIRNTHGDYIDAAKRLGAAEGVPVLDLAARSKRLYEQYGPEESKKLFMWTKPGEYGSFPDGTEDNTHFNETGAIEIARLVAEEIRELPLTALLPFLR